MILEIRYRSSVNIVLTNWCSALHSSKKGYDDLSDIKKDLKACPSINNVVIRSLTISTNSNKISESYSTIKDFSDILKLVIELRNESVIRDPYKLTIETTFNDYDSTTKDLIEGVVSAFCLSRQIALSLHYSYRTPPLLDILRLGKDHDNILYFYGETDDNSNAIECKHIKNITPKAPKFTELHPDVLITDIKDVVQPYSSQRINYVDEDTSKMYKLMSDTDLSISSCPTIKRIKLSSENSQNSVHITSSSDNFVTQNVITNQVNNHNNSYTSELNDTISEYQTQPLDLSCKLRQVLNNDICAIETTELNDVEQTQLLDLSYELRQVLNNDYAMEYCSTEHLEGENHTIHPSSYCYNGSISKDSELDVSCIDRGVEIYEDYQ